MENSDCFPYEEIPHFPVSTVTGHESRLLFGVFENVEVLVMQGRFHAYEGYPLEQVRFCSPVAPVVILVVTEVFEGTIPSKILSLFT